MLDPSKTVSNWEGELGAMRQAHQKQTDELYNQRARLIALLTKLLPNTVQHSSDVDFPLVVFIALPTGQASWHISKEDLYLFTHLTDFARSEEDAIWDGHTTEEKHKRMEDVRYDIEAATRAIRVQNDLRRGK